MTFKIGDRVRVKCAGSRMDGHETTVLSGYGSFTDDTYGTFFGYEVEDTVDGIPGSAAFEPHELIKLGDDLGSWDEIEKITKWNPHRISA